MQHELLDPVMNYLFNLVPSNVPALEILSKVFNNDPKVPIDAILIYLQKEGYIYTKLELNNNMACRPANSYTLTIPGIAFYNSAIIQGHPYLSQEKKQYREMMLSEKEAWPKRNWRIMTVLTFALGITATVVSEALKQRLIPISPPQPQIIIIKDTAGGHLMPGFK